jgi:hypothetical protein
MRIDHTHKPWMGLTVAATLLGAVVYVPYAIHSAEPGGGTAIGLAFGAVALALMLFSALLSLRKRFPVWRIGRARIWMRAHLWLGFLALPMVLFHAAFHARGLLTGILLWLTVIVVASGIVGAWLQHTLPTKMFREVAFETIYDQIPVIRAQLLAEADGDADAVTQSLAPAVGPGATVVDTLLDVPGMQTEIAAFDRFYRTEVRTYLAHLQTKHSPLADREWAHAQFDNFRRQFQEAAWKHLSVIEEICEEKRQLDHQVRLHRTLHGWLLLHLPFSAALILLAIVHAIGALRY